jgi:hypothetical protein
MIFLPDSFKNLAIEDIDVVQRLVKEVGEALQELGNTLANGLVEDHEYPRTIAQLNDVVHECARLKQWLKMRWETDRHKVPPTKKRARGSLVAS